MMISSSNTKESELASTFARRVIGSSNPWETMRQLIQTMRKATARLAAPHAVERYLVSRNVTELRYDGDLDCDGFVQPLGLRFEDGFRIVLNPSRGPARLRFTLAHEICHTFFYEYVPELKFMPHECDETEESLCNFGAAELLMPVKSLVKAARAMPVSIRSLEALSTSYAVSKEAMLVRLRSLRLWNADLSFWTRRADGLFIPEQVGGFRRVGWRWTDNELAKTWETGEPAKGKTFVRSCDVRGKESVLPICFEMQKRHNRIQVLWGAWANQPMPMKSPLFPTPETHKVRSLDRDFHHAHWAGDQTKKGIKEVAI